MDNYIIEVTAELILQTSLIAMSMITILRKSLTVESIMHT